MRKTEHKIPGTRNAVAPAYENVISQLTTPFLRLASNDTLIDI